MSNAKIVVLCISEESISPSGVGVYLQAMALGKCVIISDCPATRGILEDSNQAILVPQHDVEALAKAIEMVWCNDNVRKQVARAGRQYAISLGGEQELVQRMADCIAVNLK